MTAGDQSSDQFPGVGPNTGDRVRCDQNVQPEEPPGTPYDARPAIPSRNGLILASGKGRNEALNTGFPTVNRCSTAPTLPSVAPATLNARLGAMRTDILPLCDRHFRAMEPST